MKQNIIAVAVGISILSAGLVSAQNYPSRPIRIVTAGTGSGTDFSARLIAQGLSGALGQNVIVENRPSTVLGESVARASPDGYTLLLGGGTFLIGPLLQKRSYDPVTDFLPISIAASAPNILVVNPSLPAKSVQELLALARARPSQLNYRSGTSGSSAHLAGELFKSMAGLKIVRVDYKATAQAVTGLMGGEVQMMFGSPSTVIPHIQSGKLRGLAVTSPQPSALAPGLPTVAASGVPGYETESIDAVMAPAKTPSAIIHQLSREIARVLKQEDVKERFRNSGVEAVGSSPEELANKLKGELTRMGKVIKDAGIRVD